MKVKYKLISLVVLPALMTILLIAGVEHSFNILAKNTLDVIDKRMKPVQLLEEINHVYSHGIIDLAHKTRSQMLFWNEAKQAYDDSTAKLEQLWQSYNSGDLSEQELMILANGTDAINKANENIEKIGAFIDEKSSYSMGSFVDLELYSGFEPVITLLRELTMVQSELATQTAIEAEQLKQRRSYYLYMFGGGLILFCVILGVWIIRELQGDLERLLTTITKIEMSKNLTLKSNINKKNEFGDMSRRFDRMIGTLNNLILDLHQSGSLLATTSSQQITVNTENKQQSDSQLAALDATKHAVTELNEAADVVLTNIDNSNALTTVVHNLSKEGFETVQKTINSIESVNKLVAETSSSIQQLKDRNEQISTVVTVINNIAEQTNLLALNAAIEAARAGEQGRGFAVVADEVRQLASRTAESTKEIQTIVEEIQSSTEDSWQLMKKGEQAAVEAVAAADESGNSMNQIASQFDEIAQRGQEIKAASQSQQQSAKTVIDNMAELESLSLIGDKLSTDGLEAAENTLSTVKGVNQKLDQFTVA